MTDEPLGVFDGHWEAYEVTADHTHRFLWMWHGYNIRVIGVPRDAEQAMGYDWSWCYPKTPVLVVRRLQMWKPFQEDEPLGWHKRPTSLVRRAPHRHLSPQYNRPRCVHGRYADRGCATIGCENWQSVQRKGEP